MKRRWSGVFVILIICFIWGNSLMPARISKEFSNFVRDILNAVFFSAHDSAGIKGTAVLRKIAHATEFAALGVAAALFVKRHWKRQIVTLLLWGVMVALVDETIQIFVAGRGSQVRDVWIDFSGFLLGCAICLGISYIKNRLRQKKAAAPRG